jgi:uncharacterized protein YbbK (DUF523 family)
MNTHTYIHSIRTPDPAAPLRILLSACLAGIQCGVDGTSYREYPEVLRLLHHPLVRITAFCPEDFAFGTPREMCDIYGGNGLDVLEGRARVLTTTGTDWTEGMIRASERMLAVAQQNNIELAIMMDISAACGSRVIYDGNRYEAEKKYQTGMGVCGAQLARAGFHIISQRDYASLEWLYAKIEPDYQPDPNAIDFDQHPWYVGYFGT